MVRPCSCPSSESVWDGARSKEHRHVQHIKRDYCHDGHRYREEFVPRRWQRGAIVLRQKWSRGQIEARLANIPPCLIGMEACVGAHHLSRKLRSLGHDARLMPAKYVPSLQIALATYPKRLARIHTSLRTSACYICRMNDSVRRDTFFRLFG